MEKEKGLGANKVHAYELTIMKLCDLRCSSNHSDPSRICEEENDCSLVPKSNKRDMIQHNIRGLILNDGMIFFQSYILIIFQKQSSDFVFFINLLL